VVEPRSRIFIWVRFGAAADVVWMSGFVGVFDGETSSTSGVFRVPVEVVSVSLSWASPVLTTTPGRGSVLPVVPVVPVAVVVCVPVDPVGVCAAFGFEEFDVVPVEVPADVSEPDSEVLDGFEPESGTATATPGLVATAMPSPSPTAKPHTLQTRAAASIKTLRKRALQVDSN
jgi:hypothetical protein